MKITAVLPYLRIIGKQNGLKINRGKDFKKCLEILKQLKNN